MSKRLKASQSTSLMGWDVRIVTDWADAGWICWFNLLCPHDLLGPGSSEAALMWCSSLACKDVGEKVLAVQSIDGALKWVFSLALYLPVWSFCIHSLWTKQSQSPSAAHGMCEVKPREACDTFLCPRDSWRSMAMKAKSGNKIQFFAQPSQLGSQEIAETSFSLVLYF